MRTRPPRRASRRRPARTILGIATIATAALLATPLLVGRAGSATAAPLTMTVYKSPSCVCCGQWVEHMRASGATVRVVEQPDVTPVKRERGVPPSLYSCHTSDVAGYVVEGHVPSEDVRRLVAERPAVAGIAAGGMPAGAPGMPGRPTPYEVTAFTASGATTVFATH